MEKQPHPDEFHNLVQALVDSDSINQIVTGSKLCSSLEKPEFNLDHSPASNSEGVLFEVIKQLKTCENVKLLDFLYTRGLTDNLPAEIREMLSTPALSQCVQQRIYSLFYISPLNYSRYEIYQYGFSLDEHIVIALIKALSVV